MHYLKMANEYIAGQTAAEFYSSEQGSQESTEVNYQEAANINAARARENTASFLAGRHDRTLQVGGTSGDEQLISLQRELNNAHNSGDLMKVERLERQVYEMASGIVGGPDASRSQESYYETEPKSDLDDLLTAEAEGLASDPSVQSALNWAQQTLPTETVQMWNELTDAASKPETIQAYARELKNLQANPDSFSTEAELNPLSDATLQYFSNEYSPEISQQVATLSAAVRNGVCSRQQAMITAIKSPGLAKAMLDAAHNGGIDFKLAL